jgi:hypothetical protein
MCTCHPTGLRTAPAYGTVRFARRGLHQTAVVELEAEVVKAVEELDLAAVTVVKEVALVAEEAVELMVAVIRSRLQHAHCLRDRR